MAREPLRVVINRAAERLADAGVPSPKVDAEELAAFSLGIQRTRLGLQPLVESEWVEQYNELVGRRAQRIPLQHLFGSVQIGRATIAVGPGVFIPRPETELLVDWALTAISGVPDPVVVDLCTGSGAIALAIAAERPDARVIAVERADGALAWARRNLELQLEAGGSAVELRGGDFNDPRLLYDLDGAADLVTANPPYVPAGTPVQPEVADHDPPEAVFAGPDGLEVIRPLINVAAVLLKPGGLLAIEHDDSHGESVPALLSARKVLADVADHRDLAGRPRFVTARRVSLGPG
ncbi:peptide chain release factor N(5)-glutamine methyltransferase [Nakamurella lactea]|uniref:peptide chain release factor N(5)-glutamine methyltransferase n=1 Tax=Nakamurella lactea TaxID=459515 RepID=UPI00048FE7F3